MVLVNYYANAAAAPVFKAAHHAAVAINLHITTRTHDLSGQKDREVHDRAHGYVAIDCEEHAVGGNVLRLCGVSSALRLQLDGQMQRKARDRKSKRLNSSHLG